MGRCAMIWSTAGTNRVCSRCLALKDTVVGYTDESGVTLPPLHPRCRCTIIYDEIGTPQADKPLTSPATGGNVGGTMSADNEPKWPPRNKANTLSKEEYAKLRDLATANGIALSGVKSFDGSADVVREIIETLSKLQETFPAVRDERYKLTLKMDLTHAPKDYAITRGKIISLNANAYRNVKLLAAEYQKDVDDGWFVKGTTYRAIPHHEFGHVVADVYKLDPLKIACEVTGLKPKTTLDYLDNVLSKYAGGFVDGSEIISEVFADISTGSPSEFSRRFYNKILVLTGGGNNV